MLIMENIDKMQNVADHVATERYGKKYSKKRTYFSTWSSLKHEKMQ